MAQRRRSPGFPRPSLRRTRVDRSAGPMVCFRRGGQGCGGRHAGRDRTPERPGAALIAAASLAAGLLLAGQGQAPARERLPVAVEILALDGATLGQSRAVAGVLAATGQRHGNLSLQPWVIAAPESCGPRRPATYAEACVRRLLAAAGTGAEDPPHVVLMVEPGSMGRARVSCLGPGPTAAGADFEVDPDSAWTRGDRQWREEQAALTRCVAAAAMRPRTP